MKLTMLIALILAAADTAKLPEPASYAGIGWLVVAVGSLGLFVNQVDDLIGRHRSRPPAGELRLVADALATRLTGLEEKYDHFMSQCENKHKGLNSDELARRLAIDQKLEAVRLETKADLKSLETKLDHTLASINTANEARASEIHKRTNEILAAVAEVRGHIKLK